jgi:glucokinase
MILAGDIGGTHARVALFSIQRGRAVRGPLEIYPTHEHASLESVVRTFLDQHPEKPRAACFGVAGPVRDGRAQMANVDWTVDSSSLAREIGCDRVILINDLVANAWGIGGLAPGDFATLNIGARDARGNIGVISAGTGLGEAGLYFDGSRHHPFASEGGHADFAPIDELQTEMLAFLRREFGHVSVERVLSGSGLHQIYRFLRDTGRGDEPASLRDEIAMAEDPAIPVWRAATGGGCALAAAALEVFVSVYGAEAGNLALKLLACGGIYLGGGLAPRIIEQLNKPGFGSAFTGKGRMKEILAAIPVRVILNDEAALIGAARAAATAAAML